MLFNQLCKYLTWINFLHNNISRTMNVHIMTTACIAFFPPSSLRRSFQRCHLLSLGFSKYMFAILAVTRIRDKNTSESTREYSFIHAKGSWRCSGIQCRGRALGLRWTKEQKATKNCIMRKFIFVVWQSNTKDTSKIVPVNTLSDSTSDYKILNYVIIHGP